jgi:Ca2+-binding EF-hand superfamily protein
MKRLLLASVVTALVTALLSVRADGPPAGKPKAPAGEAYDFVFFGQTRPVLLRMHVTLDGHRLEAVWADFIDALFKHLDTDGDGVLSEAELKAMPPPSSFFGGGGGLPRAVQFARIAAARMGGKGAQAARSMTRKDLAEHFRSQGAGPLKFGNGNIQMDGLRLYIAGMATPPSADETNRLLFEALDKNKDGKLTADELAAGEALLRKLDANDDEMLTPEELTPHNIAGGGDEDGAVFAFAVDSTNNTGGKLPLLALRKGGDKDLARRLLEQYGPKSKTGPAKSLRREHLSLDEAAFAVLDIDGNGSLDAEELARFSNRPADVELDIAIVQNSKTPGPPRVKVLNAESSPLGKSLQIGKDGSFTLDLGATRLTMGAPVPAMSPDGARIAFTTVAPRQQYLQEFKRADKDGNGYLDAEEAKRSPLFSGIFNLVDRDHDGKVFENEVIAYVERTEKLQRHAARSYATLNVQTQASGLFDMLDTNHDNRLSVRELRQLPKLLKVLDRNGDGVISADEVPKTYNLTLGPGGGGGGYVNAGNVIIVDNAPQLNPRVATIASGPLWFRKMDRNRDGDVSRREFLGTDSEFRKIDTDGDGLISLEEAMAAEKLFRKSKPGK